jgi:hypothetical protein
LITFGAVSVSYVNFMIIFLFFLEGDQALFPPLCNTFLRHAEGDHRRVWAPSHSLLGGLLTFSRTSDCDVDFQSIEAGYKIPRMEE